MIYAICYCKTKRKKKKKRKIRKKKKKERNERTGEKGRRNWKIDRDTSNHVPHLAWRCSPICLSRIHFSSPFAREKVALHDLVAFNRGRLLLMFTFVVDRSIRFAKISPAVCALTRYVYSFVRIFCVAFASYYRENREDDHRGYCAKGSRGTKDLRHVDESILRRWEAVVERFIQLTRDRSLWYRGEGSLGEARSWIFRTWISRHYQGAAIRGPFHVQLRNLIIKGHVPRWIDRSEKLFRSENSSVILSVSSRREGWFSLGCASVIVD